MQDISFRLRFDAASGLFQLEVQLAVWSAPIELARIERIIKQESVRRSSEGRPAKGVIPAAVVLAEALLNAPKVRKIPAKGNRAQAEALQAAELDEILGLAP